MDIRCHHGLIVVANSCGSKSILDCEVCSSVRILEVLELLCLARIIRCLTFIDIFLGARKHGFTESLPNLKKNSYEA